ncbi:MAG: hypothetical protein WBR13_02175 [Allosphingosinicella sp.]
MIRIDKGDAPAVLLTLGVEGAQELCEAYDKDPAAYDGGLKTLTIKDSIYGHKTVRDALDVSHHGKCAFCEVRIPRPYAVAHVEHWRPKGSFKQARGIKASPPGYYWLAYAWDNLLLACQFCNSSNKGTQFPLDDPAARARNHHRAIAAEAPQLLKPDAEDPTEHIEFVDEMPRGISARGKATIKVLGLDRLEHKPRDKLIAKLRDYHAFIVQNNEDPHPELRELVTRRREFYERAADPSSPFSAMAAAFAAKHPLPPMFVFPAE